MWELEMGSSLWVMILFMFIRVIIEIVPFVMLIINFFNVSILTVLSHRVVSGRLLWAISLQNHRFLVHRIVIVIRSIC